MEKLNIILSDGIEREVDCIFYLYNSKYYFIYTLKEIDDNGYVILYVVQVGKEIINTENGQIETGYMVGVEINDEIEWKDVKESISKIVEDAKNGTKSLEIQYLPLNMLSKLKIVSKKTFRLMKDILINNLNVDLEIQQASELMSKEINIAPTLEVSGESLMPMNNQQPLQSVNVMTQSNNFNSMENNLVNNAQINLADSLNENDTIIIDYRTKYFEEQEKNNELQNQINELNNKLEQIKNILN